MNSNWDIKEYITNKIPNISDEDLTTILNLVKKNIDNTITEYAKKCDKIKNIALELSNYSEIVSFLVDEISEQQIDRYISINWKDFNKTKDNIWNTCSGRSPYEIKCALKEAACKRDSNSFVGALNELLGNCCITSINDLDDDV